jgi:hypothetical protein
LAAAAWAGGASSGWTAAQDKVLRLWDEATRANNVGAVRMCDMLLSDQAKSLAERQHRLAVMQTARGRLLVAS